VGYIQIGVGHRYVFQIDCSKGASRNFSREGVEIFLYGRVILRRGGGFLKNFVKTQDQIQKNSQKRILDHKPSPPGIRP